MKPRIILLGPPASGKGMQASRLSRYFEVPAVSTGAILRDEQARGSEIGLESASYTAKGGLAPDALVMRIIDRWLEGHTGGFIFDGFPRTLVQARLLTELLQERKTPLDIVLSLETPLAIIEDRVTRRVVCSACGAATQLNAIVHSLSDPCPLCGGQLEKRLDDTLPALEFRMEQFREKTGPVIQYYRDHGLLVSIDAGDRGADLIFEDLCQHLENSGKAAA